MTVINTVLVPIDFSEGSRQALRLAWDIARDAGARLEVLHVIETPYLTGADLELAPTADLTTMAEQAAQTFVEDVRGEADGAGEVAIHFRTGSPAPEILRFLQTRPDIDLVAMATHGRGRIARLMLGSVADKIVRASPCPVLTVRAPEPAS